MNGIDLTRIVDLCKRVFPDAQVRINTGRNFNMYGHDLQIQLTVRGYHGRMEVFLQHGLHEDRIANELCRYVMKELMNGR